MDEPVTPAGRLFLRPELNQIINCAIGFENPLDTEAIKAELSGSLMVQHPRFSSLLVKDNKGRENWRKAKINLDDHIIIHNLDNSDHHQDSNEEENINSLLAEFSVSCPLSNDKPLWEVHIISELKCVILRIHHALGDGISLMTLFLASCKSLHGNQDYKDVDHEKKKPKNNGRNWGNISGVCGLFNMIWHTIVFIVGFCGRVLWVSDKKTVISGGDGVELWPRLVATAKFNLDDMKTVKQAIPNATINDVLFGVISNGFSRYLSVRSPHVLQEEVQITGLAMVNLRKQPGLQEMAKLMNTKSAGMRWGNRFGMMLLPVYCHMKNEDPLSYVKRAKVMIDKKKQSLEAHFSYGIGNLIMSLFGPKMASLLNYRIVCNTTFTISNIVGPSEELTYAGNSIIYIRATSSSLAHVSAILTGEFNMKKELFPGFARPYVFYAKILLRVGRVSGAKNCARVALKSPWWTLGCPYQEVADIAQWDDEQIEYIKEKVTEEGRQGDLKKGKEPPQVALDEAVFLLDLASIDGSWDECWERVAECYKQGGLPDIAKFILCRD